MYPYLWTLNKWIIGKILLLSCEIFVKWKLHAVLEMDTWGCSSWRVKAQAPHPYGSSEALHHNPISTGLKPHYILVQGSTTTFIFIRSLSFKLEYIQEKIENDRDWDLRDFLILLRILYGRISTMPLTKNANIFCMPNLSKNWWNIRARLVNIFKNCFLFLKTKNTKNLFGKGGVFLFFMFSMKDTKTVLEKTSQIQSMYCRTSGATNSPKSNCL